MTTIMPTRRCFDDSLDTLVQMIEHDDSDGSDLRLVHALCTAPDGHLYAHAWVEFDRNGETLCVFSGLVDGKVETFASPQADFYVSLRVTTDITKYRVGEALAENLRVGTYGPWLARYLERTGGSQEWVAP